MLANEIVDALVGSEESGVAGSETCETLTLERKAALFLLRALLFDLRLIKTLSFLKCLRALIMNNQASNCRSDLSYLRSTISLRGEI